MARKPSPENGEHKRAYIGVRTSEDLALKIKAQANSEDRTISRWMEQAAASMLSISSTPVDHAKVAAIFDDLSGLYRKTGDNEQAAEMYRHARWHEREAKGQNQ